MQTGREASLAKAVSSPGETFPASLLADLSAAQWTASFAYLLEAALVLFQSVSRLEVTDVHNVATIQESCDDHVSEVRRRVTVAFSGLTSLLKCVPVEKKVTVEIEALHTWLQRFVGVTSQSILNIEAWSELRDLVLSLFCVILYKLVKSVGEQLHCPAFYRLVAGTCLEVSTACEAVSAVLRECLYRVGPLFADLAETYIKRFSVCEKATEALRMMSNSTDVTLGVAKKMRSRKLGNSHQKRSQKNHMRRDETKKLHEIERQVSSTSLSLMSHSAVCSHLRLLQAYAITADLSGTEGWLGLDWGRLPSDIQGLWLDLAVSVTIRRRKGLRQLQRILDKSAQLGHLAAQSRYAMFVLGRASEESQDEQEDEDKPEECGLAMLDPDK